MSLPPPPTGFLGTVIPSWFMNLKEDEEETCFNCISMPALMYPSLVKTNNLLFLTRQKVCLLLSALIVWLERKKKYIYIKHYIKSEFQEQSILIKRDVLYDTCTWDKIKKNSIIVVLRPCWAKWNAEITERWILVLEGSIVLKLQQVN